MPCETLQLVSDLPRYTKVLRNANELGRGGVDL